MICETDLPPSAGAYALLIETRKPTNIVLRGATVRIGAGQYLYCGSARGPGGIRARVGRHLRKIKTQHWHVDRLTGVGSVRGVIVAPGGDECELFARFAAVEGAEVPVPGFGASDCRRCPAHLLRMGGLVPMVGKLTLAPSEYLLLSA